LLGMLFQDHDQAARQEKVPNAIAYAIDLHKTEMA
jgi:hypothetical protein